MNKSIFAPLEIEDNDFPKLHAWSTNTEIIKPVVERIGNQVEVVIMSALQEEGISLINTEKIKKECKIIVQTDGKEILYHLDKPLLVMHPVNLAIKTDNETDCPVLTVSQKFERTLK